MSKKIRLLAVTCGMILPLVTASIVFSQGDASNQGARAGRTRQSKSTARDSQTSPTATRGQSQASGQDSQLAQWLIVGNQGEVELGEFASEKAESEEVKQFAQQMVQEHGQMIKKLQKFGGQTAHPRVTSDIGAEDTVRGQDDEATEEGSDASGLIEDQQEQDADEATQESEDTEADAATRAGEESGAGATASGRTRSGRTGAGSTGAGAQAHAAAGGQANWIQIKQEIGQQCLELTKSELSEKQGNEFDKCYVGQQIVAHVEMLATLKALKNHASSEFQEVLDEGEQTTQQHLDHAKQLAMSLEQGGQPDDAGAARSTPRSKRSGTQPKRGAQPKDAGSDSSSDSE